MALTTWKTIQKPTQPIFITIEAYDTLFKEQSKIGWNHVIHGRLSKSWVDIQNQYNFKSDDGISIMSVAIGKIYKIIYHMWKYRCDIKYRTIDQTSYLEKILNPKIRELYNKQDDLDAIGKIYFERQITNIFQQTTPYIHQWIKKSEEIIRQSIQRTKNQLDRIPRLDTFFPRRSNAVCPASRRESGLTRSTARVSNIPLPRGAVGRSRPRQRDAGVPREQAEQLLAGIAGCPGDSHGHRAPARAALARRGLP